MTPSTTTLPTRQQLIDLLNQHKQEWRHLYGIQDITLFGSLDRNEATASSDMDLSVTLEPPNPIALMHFRDAVQELVAYAWIL
jgi:predicted nucleotidyltransferase